MSRVCGAVVLGLLLALEAVADEPPPLEIPRELTAAQRDAVVRFAKLFESLNPDAIEVTGWSGDGPYVRPQATLEIDVRGWDVRTHAWIMLTMDDNLVADFSVFRHQEERDANCDATKVAPLTKERTFEAARPVLEFYGLEADPALYTIDVDTQGDLQGLVERYLDYRGVPCWPSSISVRVDAKRGEVSRVQYLSVIPPENEPGGLSRESAVALATDWTRHSPYTTPEELADGGREWQVVREDPLGDTLMVIFVPDDLVTGRGRDPYRPVKSYYCWAVPIVWYRQPYDDDIERVRDMSVCVNIADGQIVGFAESAERIRRKWGVKPLD